MVKVTCIMFNNQIITQVLFVKYQELNTNNNPNSYY